MSPEDKLSPVLAGVSGEYYVAAELSKRGLIASITLRNTKGVDVLCSNSNATKTVGIQVKTNSGSRRSWILNQKAEDYFAENLYYVFVNLNDNQKSPNFFVVPSKVVAESCKKGHSDWLKTPGKKGQKHKDSPMRKFDDINEEYLNRWDLLKL
jgi:hypothetical protein